MTEKFRESWDKDKAKIKELEQELVACREDVGYWKSKADSYCDEVDRYNAKVNNLQRVVDAATLVTYQHHHECNCALCQALRDLDSEEPRRFDSDKEYADYLDSEKPSSDVGSNLSSSSLPGAQQQEGPRVFPFDEESWEYLQHEGRWYGKRSSDPPSAWKELADLDSEEQPPFNPASQQCIHEWGTNQRCPVCRDSEEQPQVDPDLWIKPCRTSDSGLHFWRDDKCRCGAIRPPQPQPFPPDKPASLTQPLYEELLADRERLDSGRILVQSHPRSVLLCDLRQAIDAARESSDE